MQRIEAALSEAEARLAELEGERGKIGATADVEAVDGYHIELFRAQNAVKTFQAALDAAKAAADKAAADEKTRALEARHKAVLADVTAAYTEHRPAALAAMADMIAALEALGAAKATVDGFNMQAEQAGREDLIIKSVEVPRLTNAAAEPQPPALARELHESSEAYSQRQRQNDIKWHAALAHAQRPREPLEPLEEWRRRQDDAARQVRKHSGEVQSQHSQRQSLARRGVTRRGETEEDYSLRKAGAQLGIWRRDDETADGWRLRVVSAQSKAQRKDEGADPLKLAGQLVIDLIQRHALGEDAYTRHRRHPEPVSSRTIMAAGGTFSVQAGRSPKIAPIRR
ncbi:hypothetical protein [Allomesorhizobium alhagi]|uniref:hypothetical protein n=1 Tax=Allomesorhizobium alhagi TaxID=475067 RepID=UPI001300C90B|nr:hypothetical protein [Mesorhizobium alhagi]